MLTILVRSLWQLALHAAGTALGIGLGLGLAIHVRDTLERWRQEQEDAEQKSPDVLISPSRPLSKGNSGASLVGAVGGDGPAGGGKVGSGRVGGVFSPEIMADRDSYHMLMLDAGYTVSSALRGSVVKSSATSGPAFKAASTHRVRPNSCDDCTRGPSLMKELYPRLPQAVNDELGKLMDLILRDFVQCWFCSVDGGVRPSRPTADDAENDVSVFNKDPGSNEQCGSAGVLYGKSARRTMLYSTRDLATSPFMDVMYDSMAYVFGNLALTAMDRVNLLRFVLITVTEVLAKTLRVYREMRERALKRAIETQERKAQENNPLQQRVPAIRRVGSSLVPARLQVERSASNAAAAAVAAAGRSMSSVSSAAAAGRSMSSVSSTAGEALVAARKLASSGSYGENESTDQKISRGQEAEKEFAPDRLSGECDDGAKHALQENQHEQQEQELKSPSPPPPPQRQQQTHRGPTTLEIIDEVAVAREFLLAGRLHRAVTFGVDVPSLLFAQADEFPFAKPGGGNVATAEPNSRNSTVEVNSDYCRNSGRKDAGCVGTFPLPDCERMEWEASLVQGPMAGDKTTHPKVVASSSSEASSLGASANENGSGNRGELPPSGSSYYCSDSSVDVHRPAVDACSSNSLRDGFASIDEDCGKLKRPSSSLDLGCTAARRSWRRCPICFSAASEVSPTSSSHHPPDALLHHRLFCSPLLEQSELDYNRMVGSRILRKLVPAREGQSFVVRSFGVEMLASCILTPIMGMITPEYVNTLIVTGLSSMAGEASSIDAASEKVRSEAAGFVEDEDSVAQPATHVVSDAATSAGRQSSVHKSMVSAVDDVVEPGDDGSYRHSKKNRRLSDRASPAVSVLDDRMERVQVQYDMGDGNRCLGDSEICAEREGGDVELEREHNLNVAGAEKYTASAVVSSNALQERDGERDELNDDVRSFSTSSDAPSVGDGDNGDDAEPLSSSDNEIDASLLDDEIDALSLREEEESFAMDDGGSRKQFVDVEDTEDVNYDSDDAIERVAGDSLSAGGNSEFATKENLLSEQSEMTTGMEAVDSASDYVGDGATVEAHGHKRAREEDESAEKLLPLLTLAVVEVQNCTTYKKQDEDEIDWERPSSQSAVCHLVLVVEAVLLHGRRKVPRKWKITAANSRNDQDENKDENGGNPCATLTMMLMDVTTDLDRFESSVDERGEDIVSDDDSSSSSSTAEEQCSRADPGDADSEQGDEESAEVSTLRTIIAAWLHTGNTYRILQVLVASNSLLRAYYTSRSLLRKPSLANILLCQLKGLDQEEVLVDTMTVLNADSSTLLSRNFDEIADEMDCPLEKEVESENMSRREQAVANKVRLTGSLKGSKPMILRSFSSSLDRTTSSVRSSIDRTNTVVSAARAAASDNVNELLTLSKNVTTKATSITNSVTASVDRDAAANPAKLMTNVRASMTANRQRLTRWVTQTNQTKYAQEENQQIRKNSLLASASSNSVVNEVSRLDAPSPTNHNSKETAVPVIPSNPARSPSSHHQRQEITPAYLDFHRNEAFASSLRSRREQGYKSWQKAVINLMSSASKQNSQLKSTPAGAGASLKQRELQNLHSLASCFYRSTVSLSLRRQQQDQTEMANVKETATEQVNQHNRYLCNAICTMEVVSSRRRIEVPDEDSSFLLRAQPKTLTPLGVHRDPRNHDQSFKCYLATYEEGVTHQQGQRCRGGRVIHKCLLRYYPIDKTATVGDVRSREVASSIDTGAIRDDTLGSSTFGAGDSNARKVSAILPERLMKERNLCQKTRNSGNVLTGGNVMEPTDFTCIPRTGRAIDFVYRMSLFERPVVEIAGRRFTVHDSTTMRQHRADASARELSDAALSVAILTGGDLLIGSTGANIPLSVHSEGKGDDVDSLAGNDAVGMGSVALRMKVNGTDSEGKTFEQTKEFRPSLIRAALLVTSARQEAQLQCLLYCVKAGSARQATKARAEALLQPTLSLLEFSSSRKREKEQILLRDLGIGITHIDREQLRRNGIMDRRYPAVLRRLRARIEDVVQAKAPGTNRITAYYKIKCAALVEEMKFGEEDIGLAPDREKTKRAREEQGMNFYREEWVVQRPFRDFVTLHKHLKSQIGDSAPRFAAFAGTGQRKGRDVALIPSLSQATKAVSLGTGKKAFERRREVLNQYFHELLSPGHLMSTSSELLRFLAAHEPLQDFTVERSGLNCREDPWGRREWKRSLLKTERSETRRDATNQPSAKKHGTPGCVPSKPRNTGTNNVYGNVAKTTTNDRQVSDSRKKTRNSIKPESIKKRNAYLAKIAFIRSRVDKVKLSDVRNVIFDLLRQLFDLDNATFWRSRMFSAIRTMSYVVTSAQEFNKILMKFHLDYLTGEKVGELIRYGRETLWPNGIFFTPGPESTEEEKMEMERAAMEILSKSFPDQLQTVLGQELSEEGLAMLHEMFQNRVVVKSFGYMVTDLIWLELFPGLSDILSGTKALDFED